MGRFDPPPSKPDPMLASITASLDQLAAEIHSRLGPPPEPTVTVMPPSVTVPAPVVNVDSPLVDMTPVAAAMERFEALVERIAQVPVRDDGPTTGMVELLDSMEGVRLAIEALEQGIGDRIAGQRSHFDGRLRDNNGLISQAKPLDINIAGSTGEAKLASLSTINVSSTTATTAGVEITGSSPLTNRRSVSIKNPSSGSRAIAICETQAQAYSAGYELATGEEITLEVDDSVLLWVKTSTDTESVNIIELGL